MSYFLFQTIPRDEKIEILYEKILKFSDFKDRMKKVDLLMLLNVTLANIEASYLYEPRFQLESPIKILIASQSFNPIVDDQFLGWKPYSKEIIERHIIKSDHYTILENLNGDIFNDLIKINSVV